MLQGDPTHWRAIRISHKNLNPVNASRPKRVAIVISNPALSTTTGWPVGFWWSQPTHPYLHFTKLGDEVDVLSPDDDSCEADAMSDPEDASQWHAEDVISSGYKHHPGFMELILSTKNVDDIDVGADDALVVAGAIFLYARLSDDTPLVAGETVTGLADVEEDASDEAVWDMGPWTATSM